MVRCTLLNQDEKRKRTAKETKLRPLDTRWQLRIKLIIPDKESASLVADQGRLGPVVLFLHRPRERIPPLLLLLALVRPRGACLMERIATARV